MHEPNDIFHSSSSERENACSTGTQGKKRSNSGTGTGIEIGSNIANLSDEYSSTSHKRAKSENGKHISTSKDSNSSPPLPGLFIYLFSIDLKSINLLNLLIDYDFNFNIE